MSRVRWGGRAVDVVLWLAMTPAGLLVLARLGRQEENPVSFLLVAVAPLAYLPAYLALAGALVARRWLVAAVASVLVVSSVAWVLPGYRWWPTNPPAAAPDTAPLRIFSHNVQFGNERFDSLVEEIRATTADVVILLEVSEGTLEALEQRGAFASYPHRIADPRGGGYGIGLWSRSPLVDAEVWRETGVAMPRATLELPGRLPVRIYAVHPLSAQWVGVGGLVDQFDTLQQELEGERRRGRAVVVAGDFNAVAAHLPLRRLLSGGLLDAAGELGQAWRATWPADRWPVRPFLRLDHVLVSDDLAPVALRVGPANGSDHRSLTLDVAVPGFRAAGDGTPAIDGRVR